MVDKIEISTALYQSVHGRKPRGYSLWYFWLPGGLTFSHAGTYGSAVRAAAAHARRLRSDIAVRVQLCA